jgi:flagellar protein FliS
MNSRATSAVNQYQSTGNSSIAYADPHELILRLLSGAIDRVAQAKGALGQNNVQAKGELISKAMGIINGLAGCIDHDQEGDIAANLNALYEYMNVRLLEANAQDDPQKLDEVAHLLNEIRSAWGQIKPVKNDQ